MNEVILDAEVGEDVPRVRQLIAAAGDAEGRTLYRSTLEALASGTRNSPAQIGCFAAFERALACFRGAARRLRERMDLLTREQRGQRAEVLDDAHFFANRYALHFAGEVGLAELGEAPAPVERIFAFGELERSKDIDALASLLAATTAEQLRRVLVTEPEAEGDSDELLRHVLRAVFTSWSRQLVWSSWSETARATATAELILRLGPYTLQGGAFRRRETKVEVDSRLMDIRREEVIGARALSDVLWRNLRLLACYDAERGENPFDPAFVVFTYGAPGGGKTFVSHAHIRSFVELCEARGQAVWAMTHSTTDYASHYQNKTQAELVALAERINAFPGPVVLYVADADNIFQSRKEGRLSAEQYRTLAVYLKMFDGTLIKNNGKVLAIMDANYIDGIDEATKSRLFDEICELERFDRAEDFSALVRRTLGPLSLGEDEWRSVGEHLLASPLSNRELAHVLKGLRRGFEIPDEVLELGFDEQSAFREQSLANIDADTIRAQVDRYVKTRLELERRSRARRSEEEQRRFLQFLGQGS